MNGTTFNPLAIARALREAGFDDRQAEAPRFRGGRLAEAVRNGREGLATKVDIADLRAELIKIVGVQTAFAGVIVAIVKFL